MQRQSLGSPNSKLHSHGGAKEDSLIVEDDLKRKDLPVSSSITTDCDYEDDGHKATKRHRLSSPPPIRAEKFIHFIPVLTLFCFLVLYLCSHSPTQSDLAHFNGFKWPAKRIEDRAENEIGDIDRFVELPKGDVLTIRSLRNLQGIKKHGPKSRNHRKLADI